MSDGKLIACLVGGTVLVGAVALFVLGRGTPNQSGAQVTSAAATPVASRAATAAESAPSIKPGANADAGEFRGIVWGSKISFRKEMVEVGAPQDCSVNLGGGLVTIRDTHTRTYTNNNDMKNMAFGGVRVSSIKYISCDDQFFEVKIEGIDDSRMAAVLSEKFGEPREGDRWTSWTDPDDIRVDVTLFHRSGDVPAWAELVFMPIRARLDDMQKEEAKKQIESAKKDF